MEGCSSKWFSMQNQLPPFLVIRTIIKQCLLTEVKMPQHEVIAMPNEEIPRYIFSLFPVFFGINQWDVFQVKYKCRVMRPEYISLSLLQ